jgi:hypothetical protein
MILPKTQESVTKVADQTVTTKLQETTTEKTVNAETIPDVSSSSNIETAQTAEPVLQTSEVADNSSQQLVDGFTLMESSSFKFSMQYPKKWFYNGSASTETGVLRHYDFGSKPLDQQPGVASMDLMTGSVPSGVSVNVGSAIVTKVVDGNNVVIYLKGSGSRVYKFTGPSGLESTLLQMAGSIK